MFTLSDTQKTLLLTARAAQQEGERRFDFWARREALRAASEAFGQTLADSGLAHGQGLTPETRARLLRLAAELAPNSNLSRRLWTANADGFDSRLRSLLFGHDAILDRLREFLSVRGTGILSASQLLCAFQPEQFPLVTKPALKRLRLSAAQMRDAATDAAERYGFPPTTEPDAAQRLLALWTAYDAVRDTLHLSSFADVNDALRVSLPAALPAVLASVATVQETSAPYDVPVPARTEAALLAALETDIAAQGFQFPPMLVRTLYVALKARPFVILSGASGTGKTRLAELFAEGLTGHDPAQFRLLPVRPDWADAAPLFGYWNVLANRYVNAPFGDAVRRAARPEHRRRAFFVCLDEMNLARAEHYLSDYLSALEARTPRIPLHEGVPDLVLPPNFFLLGTVNTDETTHAFSRRVLDRAHTLDFDAPPRLQEWGETGKGGPVSELGEWSPAERQTLFLGQRFATTQAARARLSQINPSYPSRATELLTHINTFLYPHRLHVAYRVRDDFVRFLAHAWDAQTGVGLFFAGDEENFAYACDALMCQKVLPRVFGLWDELASAVRGLGAWAASVPLPRTTERLARMAAQGERSGFVRFHE